MLDRVWWLWQMQDPKNRVDAIPSSDIVIPIPDLTLPGQKLMMMIKKRQEGNNNNNNTNIAEEVVDLGWTAPPAKLGDLNEQLGGLGGQFCYIYA
jgi:tyrosinase